MGKTQEDLLFQRIDAEWANEHFNGIHYEDLMSLYQQKKLFWETKTNGETMVQLLTDDHITNIRAFLTRKVQSLAIQKWYSILEVEVITRLSNRANDTKN